MEPPARPEDPADPAASPEARAQQPGKWALVRSLNQALKTYAVMPVRPGGNGRVRPGTSAGPQSPCLSGAREDHRVAKPRVHADGNGGGGLWCSV